MADSVRIKRGIKSNLPKSLPLGELAFCTDTRELYVGAGEGLPLKKVVDPDVIHEQKKLNEQLNKKMNKTDILTMANMGQDVKEKMTGGSVAVVGKNSILAENIVNEQVTNSKLKDGSITEEKIRECGKYYEVSDELDFEFSNMYIDGTGNLNDMSNWYITYPIPSKCMPIEVVVNSSGYLAGVWLDKDYNYTQAIYKNITDNRDGSYTITFKEPTDVNSEYLRLNYCSSIISSVKFTSLGSIKEEHLKDGIITNKKLSNEFKITPNLLPNNSINGDKLVKAGCIVDITDSSIEYEGSYIDNNGNIISFKDWAVTSLLDISNIGNIIYKSTQKPLYLGCFYDEKGNYIRPITYETPVEEDDVFKTTIICDNAHKIRLNIWNKTVSVEKVIRAGEIGTEHLKNKCISKNNLNDEVLSLISNNISDKKYVDVHYTRQCIADLLEKWRRGYPINIVCIGDSITNFQNSEILSSENQKNAPLGLQGNSWVRRLWKMLNYEVYNDDRTIRSENGNLGYKRYDHSDFKFVGGYQSTNEPVGNHKWATNRSNSSDSWRNVSPAGYPQIITPESSSNKMFVGSPYTGASCSVSIPSSAVKMALIFGQCGAIVNVKVNNGNENIINEDIIINAEAYELHKEFELTPGTNKTVVLTLKSGTVWLYGIEYWSSNCVRLINSGLAGNSVDTINNNFDKLMRGFNGDSQNVDLVVWEVNALNDARNTLIATQDNATEVFEKITSLGIPLLTILPHRHQKGQVTLQYDRYNPIYDSTFPKGSKLVGNKHFYPDYIRLYKTLAYKYKAGIIDMYSKSVDICGGLMNDATFPSNFFNDGIHLGTIGNDCYEEELKKVFMWEDYE